MFQLAQQRTVGIGHENDAVILKTVFIKMEFFFYILVRKSLDLLKLCSGMQKKYNFLHFFVRKICPPDPLSTRKQEIKWVHSYVVWCNDINSSFRFCTLIYLDKMLILSYIWLSPLFLSRAVSACMGAGGVGIGGLLASCQSLMGFSVLRCLAGICWWSLQLCGSWLGLFQLCHCIQHQLLSWPWLHLPSALADTFLDPLVFLSHHPAHGLGCHPYNLCCEDIFLLARLGLMPLKSLSAISSSGLNRNFWSHPHCTIAQIGWGKLN